MQSINEEKGYAVINEIDVETTQNNDENNELTHYEDSWKVVTSSKKLPASVYKKNK